MIRKTLQATQLATYSIDLPDPGLQGMPRSYGTGFIVSPDGWMITAAHVITQNNRSDGPIREDLHQAWLTKETRKFGVPGGMCIGLEVGCVLAALDFALLKTDFSTNASRAHLTGRSNFPFLTISLRSLDEGEPVYAFGYPLGEATLLDTPQVTMGATSLAPRVTSAIVASTIVRTRPFSSSADPREYVLDKALDYGNSGGPIIATETGNTHAFCSRFQPVTIQQEVMPSQGDAAHFPVVIPSLYGVVVGLHNPSIVEELMRRDIPLAEN
jgi:Trypsin-like serine proteases, typically periplasmic, contain C-terminal PDZ domain